MNLRTATTRLVANATNRYKSRKYQSHFLRALTDAELDLSIEWLYFLTLPDIKVVYDVGAADGDFSTACAKIGNIEAVVAFEPGAEALVRLQRLPIKEPKITVVPVALGSRCGKQSFYSTRDGRSSSLLPPQAIIEELYPGRGGVAEESSVEVKTLDSTIYDCHLPPPDLLKLDTQGYELEILLGATEALASSSFCIVECCYEQLYAGAPLIGDIFAFFSSRGWLNVGTAPSNRTTEGKPVFTDLVFAAPKASA